MDAGTITIICAVLGSSALTTVIQAIVGTAQKKKTQVDSQGDHLAEIDKSAARPRRRRRTWPRSTKSSGKCRSIRTSSIWQSSG